MEKILEKLDYDELIRLFVFAIKISHNQEAVSARPRQELDTQKEFRF